MRITIRQLEIFRAICQERTVSGAARRIGLSQAAVSQALGELENLLERKLFDRHGRRIALNAAGREMLPAATDIVDRVQEIERSERHPAVRIAISASLTIGNYVLPPIVARFMLRHRRAEFQVALGNTDQVVRALLRFQCDVGWVEGIAHHRELRAFPWREDELVIIARPGHPLAGRKATPEDLARSAWVLRERGSGTRAVFENACAGKFRPDRTPLEFGGLEAIKRAVRVGAGLGCISKAAVTDELRAGQLARVHTRWLNLRRQFIVLVHRDKYLDSGLRGFLDYCGVKWPATGETP